MSSDKVSTCPKCFNKELKIYQKKVNSLKKQYGKISQEKYIEKAEALPMKPADGMFRTLDQYHDIGVSTEGVFTIKISMSCTVCGFNYYYNYIENIFERKDLK